jgi:hypothetical protein
MAAAGEKPMTVDTGSNVFLIEPFGPVALAR